MEWTQQQQIYFLLQSFILGFSQGVTLDVVTGLVCGNRRRWLWTDVLFGPFAAVTTFLGALLICDGQLHPVMLLGVALGMGGEHVAIGRYLQWGIVHCVRMAGKIRSLISQKVRQFGRFFTQKQLRVDHNAKNRKKMGRFSKKDLNFL